MRNTVGPLFVKNSIGHMPIVDVRPAELYAKGHIPTAQNIDLLAIEEAGGNWTKHFVKKVEALGVHKGTEFIVYCQTGHLAEAACDLLESKGFEQTREYRGSWENWITDPERPIEV